ncbi:cytochrome P450 [Obelidium mucronatum]|nr:cytochrome P450 [Obelidium mucronatum]
MEPPLVHQPSFLLGNAKQIANNPIPFLSGSSAILGPVFRIRVLGKTFVVVDAADKATLAALMHNDALSLSLGGLETMRFDCFLKNGAKVHTDGRNPAILRRRFQAAELDHLAQTIRTTATEYVRKRMHHEQAYREANVADFALSLVASLSSHAFLGDSLAHEPAIIRIFKTYFIYAEIIAMLTTVLPSWLVPIVVFFLYPLHAATREMTRLLIPRIKERRLQEFSDSPSTVSMDLLQMMVQEEPNDENLVSQSLLLVVAAMRNTSLALTNILYELALDKDLQQRLRREMVETLGEGWNDIVSSEEQHPELTRINLAKMVLLDSFVRESLFQNAKPISTVRVAESDTVLGGFRIKKGSTLLVYGANLHGKAYWDGSETEGAFNASQWLSSNKHSTSASSDYVVFGGSRTVCPGRHFGILELKTVICVLLTRFEMEFDSGCTLGSKRKFTMKHVEPLEPLHIRFTKLR